MKLLFVHGWSVTSKNTYGGLPAALQALAPSRGLNLDIADVFLGRYISFRDEVRMDDLERALDRAVRDALGAPAGAIPPFSCITHSTGGPLVRCWLDRYYGPQGLRQWPLEHMILLAPPNHGSSLAQLGKAVVGRLKAWAEGIEPGAQILDWLELGSDGQRRLNQRFLDYDLAGAHAAGGRHFPVVLSGETIDRALYDFVNSYTGEPGSDGVVRAAAANLDARWLALEQTDELVRARGLRGATALKMTHAEVRRPQATAFRIIPNASHSGSKIGILGSPTADNAPGKEQVGQVLDALAIRTGDDYLAYARACAAANGARQKVGERFFMVVFRISDDQGRPVTDFDLILLGGPDYDPNGLPKGFFRDRQRNRRSPNTVVYYMNHDVMMSVPGRKFGFRVLGRPDAGFAWYAPAEFQSDTLTLDAVIDPNVTTYVDIVLKRHVDREAARFDPETDGYGSFKGTRPSGEEV
jgi:hypothetical protein